MLQAAYIWIMGPGCLFSHVLAGTILQKLGRHTLFIAGEVGLLLVLLLVILPRMARSTAPKQRKKVEVPAADEDSSTYQEPPLRRCA
jgi:hypothetical protein